MDLFVVNRYTDEKEPDEQVDESYHLEKVLKKIKKRKKHQENTTEMEQNTSGTVAEIENKTKDEQNDDREEFNENSSSDESVAKKSKQTADDQNEGEGFIVLGSTQVGKRQQVKRVLPQWLRKPTVITGTLHDLNMKVKHLVPELDSYLRKRLKAEKIKHLFPVQSTFIPWQLESSRCSGSIVARDCCISAPTGSGKTLAFVLPLVQHLKSQLTRRQITRRVVRVLVVLPTGSLAEQIYNTFKCYCAQSELNVILISGERTFAEEEKQLVAYNSVWGTISLVDIIVCTPGRLIDHLKFTRNFDLTHLEFLVIDEADRVLDNIQNDWLHHLDMHLRTRDSSRNMLNLLTIKNTFNTQKLLFSATLSQDAEMLQKLALFQPKLFTCVVENTVSNSSDTFIGKYTTPDELIEKYIVCDTDVKPMMLCKLILDNISNKSNGRILVFTNSLESVHRLKILIEFMADGHFTVAEISSNINNFAKKKSLINAFINGELNVLICTDLMARGIDLPNVDCVISYSVPSHLKTYIHRAGRTARAGSQGICITIAQPKEANKLLTMLNIANKHNLEQINVEENELEPFVDQYKKSLTFLREYITNETSSNLARIKKTKKMMRISTGRIQKKKTKIVS